MGSSTYWYRVDAYSFKHFVKVEDKVDKLEQKLYEKYKPTFDADMDRFNREWEEVWDVMRSKYLRQMATDCTHYFLGSFANRSPDHDRLLNSTKEQVRKELNKIMEREAYG